MENKQNILVDAFYDENYKLIEYTTGRLPKDQTDAEQIINKYFESC